MELLWNQQFASLDAELLYPSIWPKSWNNAGRFILRLQFQALSRHFFATFSQSNIYAFVLHIFSMLALLTRIYGTVLADIIVIILRLQFWALSRSDHGLNRVEAVCILFFFLSVPMKILRPYEKNSQGRLQGQSRYHFWAFQLDLLSSLLLVPMFL